VLNRAVAWKLIDDNPAKRGVPNPGRRCREQRPFDSWAQIRSITEGLGPTFGPMVVFAAATRLRPSELFALEHGDVDRAAGVVQIRRAYANGRVKHPKTRLSRRAVPLQAIALEALDQLRLHQRAPALPELPRWPSRLPQLQPAPLEACPESSWDRPAARPLRPAPHLRDLRAARRHQSAPRSQRSAESSQGRWHSRTGCLASAVIAAMWAGCEGASHGLSSPMTWMSGSGPVTRLTISRSIHGIARRTTLSVFDTGVSHLETPNDGPDAGAATTGARTTSVRPARGGFSYRGVDWKSRRRSRNPQEPWNRVLFLPHKRISASGVSGEQRSSACLPASGLKLTR
jgi:hypothetical protein